ncbi:MAG: sugar transferase [Candidatus Symbiothrix sp.]|jgi:exopolysaccharide biosynthesis polyprenyl glycosylphosphotransferase|nr:sugar transferase [Candidatus Symbiothrix sp.]
MKRLFILLVDLAIIYASIFVSYKLLGETLLNYWSNIWAFYILTPFIGVLYLILMYAFGLYNSIRRSIGDLLYTVFLISVSLSIGIMALCFSIRAVTLSFPRSVLLLSTVFYWMGLTTWQVLVWTFTKARIGVKKVIVVGPQAEAFAAKLSAKYHDAYSIQAFCNENEGNLLKQIGNCQMVFLTAGITNRGRDKILLYTAQHSIGVYFVPEYRDVAIMSSVMEKTDDIPTFYISKLGLSIEERFLKRVVDLLLGFLGFIVFLPFGLITALLVKLDGGPLFYCQERLTRKGRVFKVIKFRTMVPDAEKLSGPVLAGENDPRITKVGRIIRAIRLDEVPQILNVLKGDMSIVGPRPERPFFTDQFEKQIPHYRQRLNVKAGLTGLAQVEGKYNTSFEDKLRYDLLYISRYSLFRDILIIMQTVKILFVKDSTEGV